MKGIVIAGPTGVGKTSLSIKLGKALDADIISADSAQIYKGMDIGTAKITQDEMENIRHYMIDIEEPIKKYSVGDYQKEVDKILNSLEGKNILLVGGTGLYIDSIVRGLSNLPPENKEIREKLMSMDKEELYDKLKEVDIESAENIHINNKRRVERALEVYYITGKQFSKLSKENIKNNNYKFLKVGLERDRAELYNRIDKRVDIMVESGLIDEVKSLYNKYGGEILKKINIIGYSEIIRYFEGEYTLEYAIEKIKQNSRNYAKRQFTWFRNDEDYIWYNLDEKSEDEIVEDILKKFSEI